MLIVICGVAGIVAGMLFAWLIGIGRHARAMSRDMETASKHHTYIETDLDRVLMRSWKRHPQGYTARHPTVSDMDADAMMYRASHLPADSPLFRPEDNFPADY